MLPTSELSSTNLDEYPAPGELLNRAIALDVLARIAAAGYEEHMKSEYDIDVGDHTPPYQFEWTDDYGMLGHDNGQGDQFRAIFHPDGVLLHGFAHEYPTAPHRQNPPSHWPGIYDGMPSFFDEILDDLLRTRQTGRDFDEVTFCIWWTPDDSWQQGTSEMPEEDRYSDDPDGSGYLLEPLDTPEGATRYFNHDYGESLPEPMSPVAVRSIWSHSELSERLVERLNANADPAAIRDRADDIGYGDPAPFLEARDFQWSN